MLQSVYKVNTAKSLNRAFWNSLANLTLRTATTHQRFNKPNDSCHIIGSVVTVIT